MDDSRAHRGTLASQGPQPQATLHSLDPGGDGNSDVDQQ